jgi:hypothetical protein
MARHRKQTNFQRFTNNAKFNCYLNVSYIKFNLGF